ncbi:hypothetical protein AB3S75_045045 [Citrus x aurantiifolia]
MSDGLEDLEETPKEMASNFKCAMFNSSQDVFKRVRHIAAVEISFKPSVRKYVRSILMGNLVMSTSPTRYAIEAVDSLHYYVGVK